MRSLLRVIVLFSLVVFAGPIGSGTAYAPALLQPDLFPLASLERTELTPIEREELPPETVAVIHGQGSHVLACAFTPDGQRLALSKHDGSIDLWVVDQTRFKLQTSLRLKDENEPVYRIAFSSNGKWLTSVHGMRGTRVQLWEMTAEGAKPGLYHLLGRIDNVAFHPNNRMLVFGSNGGLLFEIGEKELNGPKHEFSGANSWYTFTPDGNWFASVVFTPERNDKLYGSEVMFWKLSADGIREYSRIQQDDSIKALAINSDGKLVATGSLDNEVRFWDLSDGFPKVKSTFPMKKWPRSVYFTPDGSHLVAFSSGTDIVLHNVVTGRTVKAWEFVPRRGGPFGTGAMYRIFSATALAPDGRHIAVSNHTASVMILRLPIPRR